jgi:hypothetical protein
MVTVTLQDCAGSVPRVITFNESQMLARRITILENEHTTEVMLVGHIYFNSSPDRSMVDPMVWVIVTSALVNAHLLPPDTLDKVHRRICNFVMCLAVYPTSNQSQTFRDMVMKAEERHLNAEGRDEQLKSICVGLVQWVSQNNSGTSDRVFNIVQGVMINEQCKLIFAY